MAQSCFSLRASLLTVVLFGCFVGCGYQLQGSGTSLPPDIKSVAIMPVENTTTEAGLGLQLTEGLISEFEQYGALQIVTDEREADAILRARVLKVGTRVESVTGSTDIELEQQLIMTVSAELRRQSGQLLWKNDALEAYQSFGSTSDVVVTTSSSFAQGGIGAAGLGELEGREVSRGQQQEAMEQLVEEVSRRVYLEAVSEDF